MFIVERYFHSLLNACFGAKKEKSQLKKIKSQLKFINPSNVLMSLQQVEDCGEENGMYLDGSMLGVKQYI